VPHALPPRLHHLTPQAQAEGARSLGHHLIRPEGETPAPGRGEAEAAGGQHQLSGGGATGPPGGSQGMVGEAGLHPSRTAIT
jgi:hypothetical protein